jgi:hypothetical protein
MKIAPVHLRGRWIDDGSPVELWNEDRSIGVRLAVTGVSSTEPSLAAMELRRISMEDPGDYTSLTIDLASGEIRSVTERGNALDPPLDLAWLQGQLDDELRAALQQRIGRQLRAHDLQDWQDGDRPRVALGERVVFAQLFPSAWDLIVTHGEKRYAVIDSYRVAPKATGGTIALEIVDLEICEPIGTAEVDLAVARDPPSGPRWAPPWRSSKPAVDPVLSTLWHDADRWFELIGRAEDVARTALVMQTWESDLRDPGAVVRELLAQAGEEDELLQARVKALGRRCIPALRRVLDDPEEETSRYAARLLAALGDASGLDELVAALGAVTSGDDEYGDHEERSEIVDAIAVLGAPAVEPLLAALARTSDRDAQDWLLDAVTMLHVHDDRIRDLLLGIVRAEPGRASRLGDYGDRSPAVVSVLVELLEAQLRFLDGDDDDGDDDEVFEDASEIVQALHQLGVDSGPVQQFTELAKVRRQAQQDTMRMVRRFSEPAPSEPAPPVPPPAPVHVTPRPGRNDPCWCGSNKKYKKCHLEADDEARTR